MNKLFLFTWLAIHALAVGTVVALGNPMGMYAAIAIMIGAFIASCAYKKGGTDFLAGDGSRARAKGDLAFATFHITLAAGFAATYASQGLSWGYFLIPAGWALLYIGQLFSVRSSLRWAKEMDQWEAEEDIEDI
mgnify:CR=1 FL=1